MLQSEPYWAPMNAKSPPLRPCPVPGHDAIVGDGAIDPPTPLRAVPAAPCDTRSAGGGAASDDGVWPEPPTTSSTTTPHAIATDATSRRRRRAPARRRRVRRGA